MLIILRQSKKHANFWLEIQYPLNGKNARKKKKKQKQKQKQNKTKNKKQVTKLNKLTKMILINQNYINTLNKYFGFST